MSELSKTQAGGVRAAWKALLLQAPRYREVAGWLVVDSLWRYRNRTAWLLLLSGLAIGLQAAALGAVLFYARAIESGRHISFAGFTADPRTSVWLLVAVLLLAGGGFVLSSLLWLRSEHGFVDLGRRYGLFCISRLVNLTSLAIGSERRHDEAFDRRQLMILLRRSMIICARVLSQMTGALPMLIGLALFTGVLIYIDFSLTIIVFAVMLASFYFFYRLSLDGAQVMRERQILNEKSRKERDTAIDALLYGVGPVESSDPMLKEMVSTGDTAKLLAAILRFQTLSIDSTHVNAIAQAIVIVTIGLVKGSAIIATGSGFGDLIVFVVAGRMAMSYFLGVTNALVSINRFYPVVIDYFSAVDRVRQIESRPAVDRRSVLPVSVLAAPLGNASKELQRFTAGARIGVIASQPPDRLNLPHLLRALGESGAGKSKALPAGSCWVVPAKAFRLGSFLASTGIPEKLDAGGLRDELAAFGIAEAALKTLPADPARRIGEEGWARVDPSALWGAYLLAAVRAARPVVVVGYPALAEAGPSALRAFDSATTDRLVIVHYGLDQIERIGGLGERTMLLFDGADVIGYATREQVLANPDLLDVLRARPARRGQEADLTDEELQ